MRCSERCRAPVLALLVGLASACGGSGGGSPAPPPPDTTPDPIVIVEQIDAATSTVVESPTVVVTGINTQTDVSISGGEYAINGGAFTSDPGTVVNDDTVVVRVVSSDETNTPVSATLTVGDVSTTYTVTTAPDITPDAFSFAALIDVDLNAVIDSNAVVISGVDIPVEVSVAGGEYSIEGGAFTSADGAIDNGESVVVRVISAATPSTMSTAAITIGTVTESFSVTTLPDLEPPVVSVLFPPLVARTSADTIVVRGTAEDDLSAITSLTVNGVGVTTSDDFATWTAELMLAPGVNSFTIAVEDAEGNSDTVAAELTLTRNVRFGIPEGLALDAANDRILVIDSAADALVAVDLATGLRSIVSDDQTPTGAYYFLDPKAVLLDAANDRALVLDNAMSAVIDVDLATGARDILSGHGIPSVDNGLIDAHDMVIDSIFNRLLVLNRNGQAVIAVDLTSGDRTVLSDSDTPDGANFFFRPTSVALDAANVRALVTNIEPDNSVYTVDLGTGARATLSDSVTPDTVNPLGFPSDIVVDTANSRALVAQPETQSIMAVDLTSGARTVFSGPGVPDDDNPLMRPWALEMDAASNRVLIVDQGRRTIHAADLATGARTIVSQSELGDSGIPLDALSGIVLDPDNGRALVAADGDTDAVIAIGLDTAERTLVSDNSTPDAGNPFYAPIDIVPDFPANRVFVLDQGEVGTAAPRVTAVDLASGLRTILTSDVVPDAVNPLDVPIGFDLDAASGRLLVADAGAAAVIAVDIGSGLRTILSSNTTPDGITPFAELEDIFVDADNSRALVVNLDYPADLSLLEVDLAVGSRSVIATEANPFGPDPLTSARRLQLAENRVFVFESHYFHTLLALDLDSLMTSLVSTTFSQNSANPFGSPGHMAYDEARGVLYMLAPDFNAILALDLESGQRVYLLR